MKQSINIQHIQHLDEALQAFKVLQQLRTNITKEEFIALYNKMHEQGYQLITLEVDHEVVAVAGVIILTNFYNGKYLFVYDLVTDTNHRSMGYGEQLLSYIHTHAKKEGCSYVSLESGLHRTDAHRFYEEKMGYSKFCYSFRYEL